MLRRKCLSALTVIKCQFTVKHIQEKNNLNVATVKNRLLELGIATNATIGTTSTVAISVGRFFRNEHIWSHTIKNINRLNAIIAMKHLRGKNIFRNMRKSTPVSPCRFICHSNVSAQKYSKFAFNFLQVGIKKFCRSIILIEYLTLFSPRPENKN